MYHEDTYRPLSFYSLNAGAAGAIAPVLVDSTNVLRNLRGGAVNQTTSVAAGPVVHGAWERAEGRRPIVTEIEAMIRYTPTTWAVGNLFWTGARFVVGEQTGDTGAISMFASYSMWTYNPALGTTPARWANEKRNLKEMRFVQDFDTNDTTWVVNMRWRGRWRLQPEHGLFLWLESASTSVNARAEVFCRTRLIGGAV